MKLSPVLAILLTACLGDAIQGPKDTNLTANETDADTDADTDTDADSDADSDTDADTDTDTAPTGTDADGDGYTAEDGDCDDNEARVNPGAQEACVSPVDDNCDGSTNDDGALGCVAFYEDADGDEFGGTSGHCLCEADATYTSDNSDDCDDTDPTVNPAATDASTDGTDQNCDGRDGSGGGGGGGAHCPPATASTAGPGGDTGVGFLYWSGCVDAPGGVFSEANFGYSFKGYVETDFVCSSWGELQGATPATDCPDCTFAFKGDIYGASSEGVFCAGIGLDVFEWDFPDLGMGYTEEYDNGTAVFGGVAMLYYGGEWFPFGYNTYDGGAYYSYVNADADGFDFKRPATTTDSSGGVSWQYYYYYRY